MKFDEGQNGAPGEIRTPDQVVRSHLLYPAELRAHWDCSELNGAHCNVGATIM